MAVSNADIVAYLEANPGLSDAQIVDAMQTVGVTPQQLAEAVGVPVGDVLSRVAAVVPSGQATLFGDTYVQPIYTQIGAGEGYQQGPLENVVTYKAGENQVGGNVNWYDPTGAYQQTTKQQEVNANKDFLKFLAGSAALFGGLGGGSLWGGAGGTAADAAAAAADADIAGGLIPEFGTNAAYDAFMSGAMTPAAMTALEELIAANPEILGSGALLTDAAAGLTAANTVPVGGSSTVVPSSVTSGVTPAAVTPAATSTVPTSISSILPSLTPTTISALTGLLGGTVLKNTLKPATTTSNVNTGMAIPTQGVPLNSQDYYNAIQQNYNQIMPNVPRDVATPLAAWYNSKYGA